MENIIIIIRPHLALRLGYVNSLHKTLEEIVHVILPSL